MNRYFERLFGTHVHRVAAEEITEYTKRLSDMKVVMRWLGQCEDCGEILYATPWRWSFFNTL
jgi:hypothetical protein